mgnify:FL=1
MRTETYIICQQTNLAFVSYLNRFRCLASLGFVSLPVPPEHLPGFIRLPKLPAISGRFPAMPMRFNGSAASAHLPAQTPLMLTSAPGKGSRRLQHSRNHDISRSCNEWKPPHEPGRLDGSVTLAFNVVCLRQITDEAVRIAQHEQVAVRPAPAYRQSERCKQLRRMRNKPDVPTAKRLKTSVSIKGGRVSSVGRTASVHSTPNRETAATVFSTLPPYRCGNRSGYVTITLANPLSQSRVSPVLSR